MRFNQCFIKGIVLAALMPLSQQCHSMETMPLVTSNQNFPQSEELKNKDLDVISLFFVAGTFHMYANYLLGDLQYLEVNKNTHSRQNFILDYDYPATNYFEDWALKPIEGYLGVHTLYYLHTQKQPNDTFGVVGYHQQTNLITIAYRGSKRFDEYAHNNFNWSVKLPVSQKKECNRVTQRIRDGVDGWHYLDFLGNLHGGYYNRIATSQGSVRNALDYFLSQAKSKYPGEKPKLLITGFSLGAGSAVLAAGFFVSESIGDNNKLGELKSEFSDINLRVFGSPKISGPYNKENNDSFGTWLEKRGVNIKSFVCGDDIVASIPPFQVVEPTISWQGLQWYSPFEEFYKPIRLDPLGVDKWLTARLYCHEVRLYMASLLKEKRLPADTLPFFRINKPNGSPFDSEEFLAIVCPQKINNEVDELDKIAIDHTLLSFHTYDRHRKALEWDPENPKLGKTKQWNPIPEHMTKGWTFYDLMGATGFELYLYPTLVGSVGYNPTLNMMIIAYRGSQQNSDWANNLNPGRGPPEGVNNDFDLHAGYVANFEHSKDSLFRNIEMALANISEETRESMTVIFTGHSLGAATATIAAYFFADQDIFKNIHLRVFAPPPVGPSSFNDWINQHLSSAKVFTREIDVLPSLFIPSCPIYSEPMFLIGKQISLPSLGDSRLNHAIAHDNRKYRRGIYEALGLKKDYEKLYTIYVVLPCGMVSEW